MWAGLSSLWSWLHADFGVEHILKKVDRPKYHRKSPEPFTENEVKRLVTACHAVKSYDPDNDCYVDGLRPTAAREYATMVVLVATGIRMQRMEKRVSAQSEFSVNRINPKNYSAPIDWKQLKHQDRWIQGWK